MAIEEKEIASNTEIPSIEAGAYKEDFYKSLPPQSDGGPVFVVHKTPTTTVKWRPGITSPLAVLIMAVVLMVGLLAYGLGASMTSSPTSGSSPATTSSTGSTDPMNTSNTQTTTAANEPNATQNSGNQPLAYT